MTERQHVKPDQRRLDVLIDRCRLEVDNGTLPSAQIAVHVDGEEYVSETFGAATPSTRYVLQSTGRTIVAGVLWKLISDGLLDTSRTVASYIPEFGTNGKDSVTVEQVVTHVGGFPLAPLGYPAMLDREERLKAFAKWRLTYEPGTELQFHLTSAAWVIAELCERLTGVPIGEYLRSTLSGPLGLDSPSRSGHLSIASTMWRRSCAPTAAPTTTSTPGGLGISRGPRSWPRANRATRPSRRPPISPAGIRR